MHSSSLLLALCCLQFIKLQLFAQTSVEVNIDTNLVLNPKKINIGSVPFRNLPQGVVMGKYRLGLADGKLYVLNKENKVLPYIIETYDVSYMDAKNKYRTLNLSGNTLPNEVFMIAGKINKFSILNIDRVYARRLDSNANTAIAGLSLLKE